MFEGRELECQVGENNFNDEIMSGLFILEMNQAARIS
jgi:hypothetical protein